MNDDTRPDEFLRPQTEIPGIRLRPLSSGSYALLVRTKNAFLQPADEAAPKPDHLAAALEYAFIHAAPLDLVLRAAYAGDDVFRTEVFRFSESIPVQVLPVIIREIEAGLTAAAAQSVDVLPRPGTEDKDAPGNS